jgi:putative endonuclease
MASHAKDVHRSPKGEGGPLRTSLRSGMQAKAARHSAKRDGGPSLSATELRLASHPSLMNAGEGGLIISLNELRPATPSPATFQNLPGSRSSRDPSSATFRLPTSCAFAFHTETTVGNVPALKHDVEGPRRFVYVLESLSAPGRPYVGLTSDLSARLTEHNAGRVASTARHRPWRAVASIQFASETTAVEFERYLKSGSGRAFAKRHFYHGGSVR